MPGCHKERFLEGFTDPFEIRFRPLIEDIEKQKGDLDGYFTKMVLHESIEALRAQKNSQPGTLPAECCRALTKWT